MSTSTACTAAKYACATFERLLATIEDTGSKHGDQAVKLPADSCLRFIPEVLILSVGIGLSDLRQCMLEGSHAVLPFLTPWSASEESTSAKSGNGKYIADLAFKLRKYD